MEVLHTRTHPLHRHTHTNEKQSLTGLPYVCDATKCSTNPSRYWLNWLNWLTSTLSSSAVSVWVGISNISLWDWAPWLLCDLCIFYVVDVWERTQLLSAGARTGASPGRRSANASPSSSFSHATGRRARSPHLLFFILQALARTDILLFSLNR